MYMDVPIGCEISLVEKQTINMLEATLNKRYNCQA